MIREHTSAVAVGTKVSSESSARLEAYCLDQWFPKWGILSSGLICDSSEGKADPKLQCCSVVRAITAKEIFDMRSEQN